MASYGWTLEEALGLTLPQMRVLYRAGVKWPTANMLAAGIGNALAREADPAKKLPGVVQEISPEEMTRMLAQKGVEA